ncbi:MAG: S8 family serine peptidase [Bacteroidetes bacterium]|nr:S8 family serine peptidase [Bacteroidota bacterium]MDA1120467.1 S8 family serine peptidase [Bacteroidota bacterium]
MRISPFVVVLILLPCFNLIVEAQSFEGSRTIMVKIGDPQLPETNSRRSNSSQTLLPEELSRIVSAESISPIISNQNSPKTRIRGSRYLSNVYRVVLEKEAHLQAEINKLLQYDNVLYAEPINSYRPLAIPDDPLIGSQSYLDAIHAKDAWEITEGDETVKIAILDTGTDLTHPDLVDNIFINEADPLNGMDDDGDGLIDNRLGYDFADSDNDPQSDQSGHGVLVSGMSSATANNGIEIAGTGFRSPFIPLKVFKTSNGFSNNTFEAILWAAQNGYKVLNLSWGAVNPYSQFEQDVINTAVLEYDAVIIVAAGNTPEELNFYPASYDNVISVAMSNDNDTKYSGSTFSYYIDLIAPGANNYTTSNGGGYGMSGPGTSFAAPLVSGAAALVRANFPEWTANQVMEQLRISSDDIYDIGSNMTYFGQLGKGRLNMERALIDTLNPSIRLTQFDVSGEFGDYFFYGDTLELDVVFENFLDSAKNAVATFSVVSEYASVANDEISFGTMATLEEYVPTSPLVITLNENTPANERILIRVDYTADNYEDWQFIQFNTTPDYLDLESSSMSLTIAGNGNMGYQLYELQNGTGLSFEATRLSNHLGLIISADGIILDNVVDDFTANTRSNDFETIKNIRFSNHEYADIYMTSSFDDSGSGNPIGLIIEQQTLAWNSLGTENYLVLEYRISNNSMVDILELNAGIFSDWILGDTLSNSVGWDPSLNLGYGFDNGSSDVFTGLALLSAYDSIFYAIDQDNLNGNTADIGTTISKIEKAVFINSGATKISSGTGGGNNVAQFSGGAIGPLISGESKKIAIAIVVGHSLDDIQGATTQVKIKYDEFLSHPLLIAADTACIDQQHVINLEFGTNFEFYSDPLGTNLIYTGNGFNTGVLGNDTAFYVQNTDSLIKTDIKTVTLTMHEIIPDFSVSTDTLFLGDIPNNTISFSDQTAFSASWLWNFNNENGSTSKEPISQFNEVGDYTITLDVSDKFGCVGQISKVLRVRQREPAPTFDEFSVCKGDAISISSVGNNILKVYSSNDALNPEFQGVMFLSQAIISDTIFYISSADTDYESVRVTVPTSIIDVAPDFEVQPDTLNLNSKTLIQFLDASSDASSYSWRLDGIEFSTEANPITDIFAINVMNVELYISNEVGCRDSLTQTISFETPQPPILNDTFVCANDSTLIQPELEQIYYYYSDVTLNDLIYKGRSFKLDPINSDTVFYVTSVNGNKESSSENIAIQFIPFNPDFDINPNPLILESSNIIELTDLSENGINWKWYFNDSLIELVQNPVLWLDSMATYKVRLEIESEDGCRAEITRILEVLDVTALDDLESIGIKFYPNPSNGLLKFEIPPELIDDLRLKIMTLTGAELLRVQLNKTEIEVDLTNLQNGIYLLNFSNSNINLNSKILIQK